MKYRKFGKLDWRVSVLGFGAMRLPLTDRDPSNIDEAKAIRMIRYAVDHGVNYIDTAYPYHGGKSEVFVGTILKDGYRDKVKVATKMPTWLVTSHEDMDRYLNEQLIKLKLDQIDFYLLHGLTKDRWLTVQRLKVFDWVDKAIADGRIRYVGFSFHDEYEVFEEIVDSYDRWDLCQIQFNFMDKEYQAGIRGLQYAASKELAVVVMEPLAGGLLALNPPEEIQAIWKTAKRKRTPAEWALQWIWNHPEASVVLSGMSSIAQVIENVNSASRSGANILTERELALIQQVREKYIEYGFIGCTGCGYCMPCPEGVNIALVLALLNEYYAKRKDSSGQEEIIYKYRERIDSEHRAQICMKCGQCEEKCPQQLPIRNLIAKAYRIFEAEEA